jgi:hypothetical protein
MDGKKGYNKNFVEAVCKICGVCPNPIPGFCTNLYKANRPKFLHHIVYKICMLREVNPEILKQIRTFEGFCALFCRSSACSIYKREECESNLSKRASCYEAFLRQLNTYLAIKETSRIFSVWSGIDPLIIGSNLGLLDAIQYLPKKKKKRVAKKIKKIMRSMYHGQSENSGKKNKTKKQKSISTLLFHNQDDAEWGKKLEEYLNEDNNRQQSKAGGATG